MEVKKNPKQCSNFVKMLNLLFPVKNFIETLFTFLCKLFGLDEKS